MPTTVKIIIRTCNIFLNLHPQSSEKELENERLEYVAFALLVYLKVNNEITGRHDNIHCPSGEEHVKMIKKITGLNITVTKTALAMKELQDLGYTENGMGGAVVCKLNYADYAGERVIEIRDFSIESIPLYYEWYINGGRLIYCSECGKLVLSQSKTKHELYCKKCSRNFAEPYKQCENCGEKFKTNGNKKYCDKCSETMSKIKGAERVARYRQRKQTNED